MLQHSSAFVPPRKAPPPLYITLPHSATRARVSRFPHTRLLPARSRCHVEQNLTPPLMASVEAAYPPPLTSRAHGNCYPLPKSAASQPHLPETSPLTDARRPPPPIPPDPRPSPLSPPPRAKLQCWPGTSEESKKEKRFPSVHVRKKGGFANEPLFSFQINTPSTS